MGLPNENRRDEVTLERSEKISTLIIAAGEPTTRALVHDLLESLDGSLRGRVSVEWKVEAAAKIILPSRDGSALIHALERLLRKKKFRGLITLTPHDFSQEARAALIALEEIYPDLRVLVGATYQNPYPGGAIAVTAETATDEGFSRRIDPVLPPMSVASAPATGSDDEAAPAGAEPQRPIRRARPTASYNVRRPWWRRRRWS